MTLATDYLLAGVTGWLAVLLYRSPQRSVRWWSYAFMALAAGAFLGGTWHGFLQNDLTRLARAEKNLEQLLASRPADRASILACRRSSPSTARSTAFRGISASIPAG